MNILTIIVVRRPTHSEKKESEATAARLKGNRCYRRKCWEKALGFYLESLRVRPYTVVTLANIAQVGLNVKRHVITVTTEALISIYYVIQHILKMIFHVETTPFQGQ